MNRLRRRLLVLAGVLLLAVTFAAAQGGLGDAAAPELEGTWRTTVTIFGTSLEGVLHTFTRGGVVLISVPLPFQSNAQGVWTRLGPRRFGFTVEMFWVDPASGQMGRTKVKEVIEVNSAGDEYRSVESSAVDYYPDGTTVPYCATTHGKRMKVERPDPCS